MISINFFIFSAFINVFVAGLLGFIIILRNRKDLINKLFFGLTISIVFWSLSYWQWMSSDNAVSALLWARFLTIGSFFIPVFYFHWILSFNNLHQQKRNLIKVLYFIIFIFLIFSFSDLFIEKVEPKSIFSFWPVPGILYTFYLFFFYLGLIIYSLIILWGQYKINIEPKKSIIKYIIIGSIIGFGGGLTNFFLWYDIPVLPYGNILISFYPIVLAIAIFKYRLFNIKVIATELLTFAIWIAVLIEVFLAETWGKRLIEIGLFVFVVFFGILVIRSVLKEVSQKEKFKELSEELEKLNVQLKVTNEKLVEMDKMKAGMYSFVSHQIKAPIGIVKGFAQLLYDGSYGKIPKKAKETAVYIKTACDRLINLTETFLNLRRIEEGKMDYQFKEINIVELIKSVFEELKLLAEQKKLEFTLECAEEKIMVKADEIRLRQVIQNLIENAIKYTLKGFVEVDLRLTTDNQRQSVLFSVSDSGIGISKEALPTLFDQFIRAKEARAIKGSGLGLYIAKQIVKDHGGEIWAESEGEGKGSRFYVKMPA